MQDQRRVPCGIAIPQMLPEGPTDIGTIRDAVKAAEGLGYDSLWVQERLIGGVPSLEPLSLLSYAAGITEKIRLGVAVVIVTTRNPVLLAKQVSTLDQLSGGRLVLGLGLGGHPMNYPLLGAPSERRVRHFVESLQVMKALWEQPKAIYSGDFWTLNGQQMEPKPIQKPHPPVLFGGRHPDSMKRAVRYADGWIGAGSASTDEFKRQVSTLRDLLDAAGRDHSTFPISKRVYVAIDNNEDRAERRLREWFGPQYGNPDLGSQVTVWGSTSRCVEGLAEVVEAGAEMLVLNSAFDFMEQMEALHRDVIPQLRLP